MGQRGPKGKPADVKVLEGNPGKGKLPEGFVRPSGNVERPTYLMGYAAEVWDRIIGAMPPGLYKPTDAEILAAYCTATATHRTAQEHLLIEGHVVNTVQGPKRNPWAVVANQARQQIATIGTRLGLDPLARENINEPAPPPGSGKFGSLVGIDGGKS